ncbi:hypothetical protein GCM10023200_26760 [Actinomycetospora chlora]|uniref:Ig-like domain-containing protein n=1 Tax=Actinomycetospora chlora TaxID=663608 RepID=A0ABP9B5D2_9PSEU
MAGPMDEHDDVAGTQDGRRPRNGAEVPAATELPAAAATAMGQRRAERERAEPAGTQAGQGRARPAEPPSSAPAASPTGDDELVRFGPEVSAEATVPGWSSPTSPPGRGTGTRRRRPGRWVGGLLTLLIVAGVVAFLLLRAGSTVGVRGVEVRAVPPTASCDTTVDVVGTLVTDGQAGSVSYQWVRSDGQTSEVLTQTIASGVTSTDVHLQWSVTGRGRLDATATLRVLAPRPVEGSGGFTYSCS